MIENKSSHIKEPASNGIKLLNEVRHCLPNPKEKLFPSYISTSNFSTSYDQIITSRQAKFQKQRSFKVHPLSVSQEVVEGCSLQKWKKKKKVWVYRNSRLACEEDKASDQGDSCIDVKSDLVQMV